MGEAGLVTTGGAEAMPLDTTEDAGTWRARRSALGLVGSSVGEGGWCGRRRRRGRGAKEAVGEDRIGVGVKRVEGGGGEEEEKSVGVR